ncbi:helicase RepA family protein [Paraburkholderia sp. EG287A]|uniref:helicase RepA family protein n=1 Tax=Paraburkholderia sp. EG287A TaxID=3237012 RepID=UPI0034D18D13
MTPTLPTSSNLAELLAKPPAPLEFVLPGLKRGSVGALVSPGGTGKSYWALQLAVALACGRAADLTGLAPPAGRVLFLSAEDDDIVLAQRLHAIAQHLPKDSATRSALARLDYRNCVGRYVDVMDSGWLKPVIEAAKDAQLIVLDTLTRFHGLDENSALDMKRLIAVLERLAVESGATVLYLHHTSKTAVMNGQASMQQAARGSSVLIDNARWAAFMAVMTEAECRRFGVALDERELYVRWNVSKQNYAAPMSDRWYRRDVAGVLLPVEMQVRVRAEAPAGGPALEGNDTHAVSSKGTVPAPAWVAEPGPNGMHTARGAPAPAAIPSVKNAFDGNW